MVGNHKPDTPKLSKEKTAVLPAAVAENNGSKKPPLEALPLEVTIQLSIKEHPRILHRYGFGHGYNYLDINEFIVDAGVIEVDYEGGKAEYHQQGTPRVKTINSGERVKEVVYRRL